MALDAFCVSFRNMVSFQPAGGYKEPGGRAALWVGKAQLEAQGSLAQGFLLCFGQAQETVTFELTERVYKENPTLAGVLRRPEKEAKNGCCLQVGKGELSREGV